MSNIERYYTGTLAPTFATCASGTEFSSIGAGYSVLGGALFDNTGGTTAPDTFADIKFDGTGTTPASGVANLGVLIYELDPDTGLYGTADLTPGAAAANITANMGLLRGLIPLKYGASAGAVQGMCRVPLPFNKFYVGLNNPLANALTSGTLKLKSLSFNLNG